MKRIFWECVAWAVGGLITGALITPLVFDSHEALIPVMMSNAGWAVAGHLWSRLSDLQTAMSKA